MGWDPSKLTIPEISKRVQALRNKPALWHAAIDSLKQDSRKGVRLLYERESRLYRRHLAAVKQHREMLQYEQQLWRQGHKYVAGVDEAGRGPLAGPVVAAAVILPEASLAKMAIQDSKQLQPEQRRELCWSILRHAVAVGIGLATPAIIDSINILQATLLAMRQALNELSVQPDIVLVDGNKTIPGCALPQQTIVKGDQRCRVIAAASIVAKVYRDRLMEQLHQQFPHYGFAEHKGYPTGAHRLAIQQQGRCVIHRQSFDAGEL